MTTQLFQMIDKEIQKLREENLELKNNIKLLEKKLHTINSNINEEIEIIKCSLGHIKRTRIPLIKTGNRCIHGVEEECHICEFK